LAPPSSTSITSAGDGRGHQRRPSGAYYYLNVVRIMFFPTTGESAEAVEYKPLPMRTPMAVQIVLVVCLLGTVWLGLYPTHVIDWANSASQQLLTFIY
jgi:NADH:ubiquinone oxidoreductase subunit 2 (subunit N)